MVRRIRELVSRRPDIKIVLSLVGSVFSLSLKIDHNTEVARVNEAECN